MDISLELNVLIDSDVWSENSESPLEGNHLISEQDWQTWITLWLQDLKPNISPIQSYALSLHLTRDAQMQHFNSTFRHINKTTDVLAFASLENETVPAQIWESHPLELGDIIISVETAQRQADENKHSLQHELAWLASHGLLHLLGWDHPNDQQLENMLNRQRHLLSLVGLLVT